MCKIISDNKVIVAGVKFTYLLMSALFKTSVRLTTETLNKYLTLYYEKQIKQTEMCKYHIVYEHFKLFVIQS